MIEKTFPITEKLLETGLRGTQKLFELLSHEHEQLKQGRNPDLLSALAQDKRDAVTQLEQFSKQFGQVLATEKLIMGVDGISHYFDKAKQAHFNIAHAWQTWLSITDLSKKCRLINEQNGASIALLSRHTQRSLQLLRGKSQLATTYGPDGSTRSELFSQTRISV
ncbi:MAG: hypothetical protein RL563_2820 [Pseudomonadota bacterium]